MWARYKYKMLLNIHADKTPHVKVFCHEHDELLFRRICIYSKFNFCSIYCLNKFLFVANKYTPFNFLVGSSIFTATYYGLCDGFMDFTYFF